MEQEVLVKVEGLSKKFCKSLKKSLRYGVQDLLGSVVGKQRTRTLRADEFWALRDINFELRRGECLGLIGHNGAGKSTLLKILNGLINPDEGKVMLKGRVSALIELGAGFNPILSGRENIYNNGAVLGFSKQEIKDKLEAIIEFAELQEFIDMPVQNYSSGMKVRLGFAVAAQMEPDVLIIDEVLAVGDLGFVLKCFKRIDAILPQTAILFVSHNMPVVSRICNKVLLLDKGVEKFKGEDVGKGIDSYYEEFIDSSSQIIFDDGSLELLDFSIMDAYGDSVQQPSLNWKDDLEIKLKFKIHSEITKPFFLLTIYDKEQRPVALLEPVTFSTLDLTNGELEIHIKHDDLQLSKGIYSINLIVNKSDPEALLLRINDLATFQLKHEKDIWPPFYLSTKVI